MQNHSLTAVCRRGDRLYLDLDTNLIFDSFASKYYDKNNDKLILKVYGADGKVIFKNSKLDKIYISGKDYSFLKQFEALVENRKETNEKYIVNKKERNKKIMLQRLLNMVNYYMDYGYSRKDALEEVRKYFDKIVDDNGMCFMGYNGCMKFMVAKTIINALLEELYDIQ